MKDGLFAQLIGLSAVIVASLSIPASASEFSALIIVEAAPAYATPDASSVPQGRIKEGTDVALQGPCEQSQTLCAIHVFQRPSELSGRDLWIKRTDVYVSPSLAKSDLFRPEAASLEALENESQTEIPLVRSWLRINLGLAQWRSHQATKAVQTLLDVAAQRPSTMFSPWAFVLAARIQGEQGEFEAEIKTYDALQSAFRPFRNEWKQCIDVTVMTFDLCGGEPSFIVRKAVIRAYLDARLASQSVIGDSRATALDKARAWYTLGHAREAKDKADPGPSEKSGTFSSEADQAYRAAIQLAPGSAPAADAAWRLIEFSRPYEFEGDNDWYIRWVLEQYGAFAKAYPRHPSAGDALFLAAKVTWARGGYPEAIGSFDRTTEPPAYLEQWFDVRHIHQTPNAPPLKREPADARLALKMFQDIVTGHPTSGSAPMARYWAAVILDYCLHETKPALAAYDDYLTHASLDDEYTQKAKRRIAALRAQP